MNSLNEKAVLRTMLRQVNVEYSALVRSLTDASKTKTMGELRTRRFALMARIAKLGSPLEEMSPKQTGIPIAAVVAEFSAQDDTHLPSPRG